MLVFGFCNHMLVFFIYATIDFDKYIYISQMCNVKNLSLIIGAMKTCMFVKFAIGCKIL
jgi:hypothetical protein